MRGMIVWTLWTRWTEGTQLGRGLNDRQGVWPSGSEIPGQGDAFVDVEEEVLDELLRGFGVFHIAGAGAEDEAMASAGGEGATSVKPAGINKTAMAADTRKAVNLTFIADSPFLKPC